MQLLQDMLSQGMCLTGVQILALTARLTQTVSLAVRRPKTRPRAHPLWEEGDAALRLPFVLIMAIIPLRLQCARTEHELVADDCCLVEIRSHSHSELQSHDCKYTFALVHLLSFRTLR